MFHRGLWAALCLALLCGSGLAADKNNPKNNKNDNPAPKISDQALLQLDDYPARIAKVNGSTLTLTWEYETLELKQGGVRLPRNHNQYQQYQHLIRLQQQMAHARTPQQQMHIMQQMAQQSQRQLLQQVRGSGQSNPYRVVKKKIDADVELGDKVSVRTLHLPTTYDDMGNEKKLTTAEIKELKGPNPQMPGYTAKVEDLKAGQEVKIHLAKNKDTDGKLKATTVVILKESTSSATPNKKNK